MLINPAAQLYIGIVIASMALVLLLESFAPLRAAGPAPLARWTHNLLLSALSVATSVVATPLLYAGARALGVPMLGGLAHSGLPAWATWALTFVALDATAYALHRLAHRVPWLWRLHAVHHTDTEVDATTAFRHHPLENLAMAALTLPVLLVLGPPPLAVFAYALVAALVSALTHGNLSLGPWVQRAIGWLLVTPDFHRVHHSADVRQTDRNYATVFAWLDHALGSAAPVPDRVGQCRMTLGLERFRAPRDQRLDQMLLQPLRAGAFARSRDGATARPPDESAEQHARS